MSADFRTRQLRVNQIINSGSASTSPLLIYGLGSATDEFGGFTSSHFVTGTDSWLFISGSSGSKNSSSRGVVTFKGDVVVSGTIYDGAGASYSTGGGGGTSNWNELSPSPRLNTTASVAIAGALGSSFAAQDSGSDTFFFVSGTTGVSGINARKSRFGGDVVVNGDLAINGGDVASSASTFNLLNNVANLNVGNSSSVVNFGSGTINIGLNNSEVNVNTKSGKLTFLENGAQYLRISTSGGTSALIRSTEISYPSLYLSGASVNIDSYSGLSWFNNNSNPALAIDASNTSNPIIAARLPDGTPNNLLLSGSSVRVNAISSIYMSGSLYVTGSASIKGSIVPDKNNTYTLGTDALRWAHVYTGDLHLRNERGDWTVIEEPDFLRIVNNKTGKNYKMLMQLIED